MDIFADPRTFVMLLSLVLSAGGSIYTWVAQRSKAAATEIQLLEAANSALERRVSTVEEALKHMPDKDSMHRLEMTVEGVKGQLNVVAKSLESVDRIAQRIDTFLLEKAA